MVPYPEQILDQVRRTIDEVLQPALDDPYAKEQARLAANLIEHVRLRLLHEIDVLQEDSSDLRRTMAAVAPAALPENDEPPEPPSTSQLEQLRAENRTLSAALEALVAGLESRASDDPAAEAALSEIRPLLVRQLQRQKRMLGPGYSAGT